MKTALLLLIILFVSALPAVSRLADASEPDIQGTWRLRGDDGKGHAWFLEWTFEKGKFDLKGYPPLHQEGSYRIVKTKGAKLTLELYEQQGNFGTENSQIVIIVNKKRDTLMIKGQGPFARVKDKS